MQGALVKSTERGGVENLERRFWSYIVGCEWRQWLVKQRGQSGEARLNKDLNVVHNVPVNIHEAIAERTEKTIDRYNEMRFGSVYWDNLGRV